MMIFYFKVNVCKDICVVIVERKLAFIAKTVIHSVQDRSLIFLEFLRIVYLIVVLDRKECGMSFLQYLIFFRCLGKPWPRNGEGSK